MADVSADVSLFEVGERGEASQMRRVIDWKHGFYIATGVPALVLVSIGPLAVQVGPPSVLVWIISVVIGMLMSFVFAEIASMFPEKTGGIPIFAAVAYRKYTPLVGPIVTWGYWFAWSPVLAINGLLVGGYVNASVFHSTNAWINWIIGAIVLMIFFAINHYGIRQGAYAQLVLGICAIVPLLLLGIVPWFRGQVDFARFTPFARCPATQTSRHTAAPRLRRRYSISRPCSPSSVGGRAAMCRRGCAIDLSSIPFCLFCSVRARLSCHPVRRSAVVSDD
jgi:amino acid transporter